MSQISTNLPDAAPVLKEGGLAVIPTDTIYGIVCSALQPDAVERLYEVRKRDRTKACIILISDISQFNDLGLSLREESLRSIELLWPGPVSIIVPAPDKTLEYLHRGLHTLAIRLPDDDPLRNLIGETGPLLAPSANYDGEPPSDTATEAQTVFGDQVEIYIEAGPRTGKPSRIIAPDENGTYTVIRN